VATTAAVVPTVVVTAVVVLTNAHAPCHLCLTPPCCHISVVDVTSKEFP
jgi:hypothetical protein